MTLPFTSIICFIRVRPMGRGEYQFIPRGRLGQQVEQTRSVKYHSRRCGDLHGLCKSSPMRTEVHGSKRLTGHFDGPERERGYDLGTGLQVPLQGIHPPDEETFVANWQR